MKIQVPGYKDFELKHLVLDYNGTMALDGRPVQGVLDRLNLLSADLSIHIITADTFGTVKKALSGFSGNIRVLETEDQQLQKRKYIESLEAGQVVAIGNGRNDLLMLESAALGIMVINEEGSSSETLLKSDIICRSINEALELLLNPRRLVATLRS